MPVLIDIRYMELGIGGRKRNSGVCDEPVNAFVSHEHQLSATEIQGNQFIGLVPKKIARCQGNREKAAFLAYGCTRQFTIGFTQV